MRSLQTVLGLGAVYGGVYTLGRCWGSTAAERALALPGDRLVRRPQIVTNHAVSIKAPPAAVWPWLTQMGWHRGGYYTPAWVDRWLFPANWGSLEVLDPSLVREFVAGDVIPDGPPGTAEYVVVEALAPQVLVLRSTTHVPPGWDRRGASIVWTWCLHLTAVGEGTRLHLRARGRMSPWWFMASYVIGLVPADFIMATGMLRGIKHRAERTVDSPVLDGLARPLGG